MPTALREQQNERSVSKSSSPPAITVRPTGMLRYIWSKSRLSGDTASGRDDAGIDRSLVLPQHPGEVRLCLETLSVAVREDD
jgi:hypothetical protein